MWFFVCGILLSWASFGSQVRMRTFVRQKFKMEFEELKIEIPVEEEEEDDNDELQLPVRLSLFYIVH